jgi:glycine/D-amino acid oxidase-like deaminating enzyme
MPEVEFAWCGRAAMTPDGLPHIYEFGPGFFGGIGCNGRGVAMTRMLGEILADAISGAKLEDLPIPLASGHPIPFHAIAPLAASAGLLRARLKDWQEATLRSP